MNKVLNILLILLVIGYIGYYFYKKPAFRNGESTPEIQAELIDGTPFKLSDLKGSYVLLDFWGSWCPPCRKDNPNLVKLYEQYHGKNFKSADGFEIVNVAIETSAVPWKKAIEKDGLLWKYHVLQTNRFKSPLALAYGVKEIPTKYLLNPEGQIIGVNLDYEKTKEILDKQLTL